MLNELQKNIAELLWNTNLKKVNVLQAFLINALRIFYGTFYYQGEIPAYKGKVVEYKQDGDLRDNENVALNPSISTTELIETYFKKEVAPHVSDAWINSDKRDAQDNEIGIVGYEIPFNRHFYEYEPPRPLEEIEADIAGLEKEIMEMLKEVV